MTTPQTDPNRRPALAISFPDAIDEAGLLAFEEKFFAGELTPTLKSEEPSDEDLAEPVKVLKGKSFSKLVLDNGEDRYRWIDRTYQLGSRKKETAISKTGPASPQQR